MYIEYVKSLLRLTGVNPKKIVFNFRGLPIYFSNLIKYKLREKEGERFPISFSGLFPVYADRYMEAGNAKGHYFHQDMWAAKKIYKNNPDQHIDIGSRIDGFISHLLIFREVVVIDVRALQSDIPGLTYEQGDITKLRYEDNTLESLSCLHAIEHIGLGRYGDDLDLDGWLKGMKEMQRVLRPGGKLYLGVPIGKEKLYFDAHRVFLAKTVEDSLCDLELESFSYVNDDGSLIESSVDLQNLPTMYYGCGLFEFVKPN